MDKNDREDMHIVGELDSESRSTRSRTTNAEYRTHLANERTFLAWCRTSISLVVFGFVLERIDLMIQTPAAAQGRGAMGAELAMVSLFAFILAGVIMLVSGWRFLVVRTMIRRGSISLSVFPELMVIFSMVAIIAMVILLVL
jgi:putative membrane protein